MKKRKTAKAKPARKRRAKIEAQTEAQSDPKTTRKYAHATEAEPIGAVMSDGSRLDQWDERLRAVGAAPVYPEQKPLSRDLEKIAASLAYHEARPDGELIEALLGELRYLQKSCDIRDSEKNSRQIREEAARRLGFPDYAAYETASDEAQST